MAREILKTMADYEGDLNEHVKTVSTVWGLRPARTIFAVVAVIALILLLTPAIFHDYKLAYILITVLGFIRSWIYVLSQVRPYTPSFKLERMSRIIKYDFMVWFVAVLAGVSA